MPIVREARPKLYAPRISVTEVARRQGYRNVEDMLCGSLAEGYPTPACCDEGCEVEPDGYCEHGHPSVLVALGYL